MFGAVIVSTDSPAIAEIARHYGAEVPFLRPEALAADLSPDIDWVRYAFDELAARDARGPLQHPAPDEPVPERRDHPPRLGQSSPPRHGATPFAPWSFAASIRARCGGSRATDHAAPRRRPRRSALAQHALPGAAPVYVQNASLEIAWVRTVTESGTIAGTAIYRF